MTARSVYLAAQAVAALLMFVGADLAQGQAIAYRGVGTNAVASSGNVTPGLPAGCKLVTDSLINGGTLTYACAPRPPAVQLHSPADGVRQDRFRRLYVNIDKLG